MGGESACRSKINTILFVVSPSLAILAQELSRSTPTLPLESGGADGERPSAIAERLSSGDSETSQELQENAEAHRESDDEYLDR